MGHHTKHTCTALGFLPPLHPRKHSVQVGLLSHAMLRARLEAEGKLEVADVLNSQPGKHGNRRALAEGSAGGNPGNGMLPALVQTDDETGLGNHHGALPRQFSSSNQRVVHGQTTQVHTPSSPNRRYQGRPCGHSCRRSAAVPTSTHERSITTAC